MLAQRFFLKAFGPEALRGKSNTGRDGRGWEKMQRDIIHEPRHSCCTDAADTSGDYGDETLHFC